MKSSSLGPLIALSALAVAPSVALAESPSTPVATSAATATTPEPAPILTTPGASTHSDATTPQALDPTSPATDDTKTESRRRAARKEARNAQATRRDPKPDAQATDPSLVDPSLLSVQAVPNFFIEDFNIPPFLLPIYQAAGSEYGIRWEVLASINHVETDFGRNLSVSTAGALGWMQFMPATWELYGVDANGDGEKDPYNPADAIFAAARYLKAAGGDTDLQKGIFSYNHAQWYVDQVIDGAKKIATYPESLISSLTALTEGISPVAAPSSKVDYPGKTKKDKATDTVEDGNAAKTVESKKGQNSIEITAPGGSPVVAVQDGTIEKVGTSERLGTYVRLRDNYGNRYTYAHLGEVQDKVPVPKPTKDDAKGHEHADDEAPADAKADDTTPTTPATGGKSTTNEAVAQAPSTPDPAPATSTSIARPGPHLTSRRRPRTRMPRARPRSVAAAWRPRRSTSPSISQAPRRLARSATAPARRSSRPTARQPRWSLRLSACLRIRRARMPIRLAAKSSSARPRRTAPSTPHRLANCATTSPSTTASKPTTSISRT